MSDTHPHMLCLPLDPPGKNRRWQCADCLTTGTTYADLITYDCTAPPPSPCKWCQQTPICAEDCMGIAVLFADPNIHVVGKW